MISIKTVIRVTTVTVTCTVSVPCLPAAAPKQKPADPFYAQAQQIIAKTDLNEQDQKHDVPKRLTLLNLIVHFKLPDLQEARNALCAAGQQDVAKSKERLATLEQNIDNLYELFKKDTFAALSTRHRNYPTFSPLVKNNFMLLIHLASLLFPDHDVTMQSLFKEFKGFTFGRLFIAHPTTITKSFCYTVWRATVKNDKNAQNIVAQYAFTLTYPHGEKRSFARFIKTGTLNVAIAQAYAAHRLNIKKNQEYTGYLSHFHLNKPDTTPPQIFEQLAKEGVFAEIAEQFYNTKISLAKLQNCFEKRIYTNPLFQEPKGSSSWMSPQKGWRRSIRRAVEQLANNESTLFTCLVRISQGAQPAADQLIKMCKFTPSTPFGFDFTLDDFKSFAHQSIIFKWLLTADGRRFIQEVNHAGALALAPPQNYKNRVYKSNMSREHINMHTFKKEKNSHRCCQGNGDVGINIPTITFLYAQTLPLQKNHPDHGENCDTFLLLQHRLM